MVWYYKLLGGNIGLRRLLSPGLLFLLLSWHNYSCGWEPAGRSHHTWQKKEKKRGGVYCVCLFVCLKQEKFLRLIQRLVTQSFPGTNEWKEHFGVEGKWATEGERWAAITDSGNATVYFLISDHDLELISTCEKCANTFKIVDLNLRF